MPLSTVDHSRQRKPRKKPNSTINVSSDQSKSCFSVNPGKKKLMLFGGLGCKGKSSPVSVPAVIRSAAQWESSEQRRRRKKTTLSRIPANNVVVDVPDVCCAPPGIGIGSASDVAPRLTPNTQRSTTREITILRQNLQFARGLDGDDQYGPWRLDVDTMSYEQLVELSDRIGYVGTGLAEEKIFQHITKFKLSATDKAWKCSICQEGYKVDDEIGKLECGHYHHIECIKQWLIQKNACPVCKSEVVHEN